MAMICLDRISGLPVPILQQILCSLSQEDAVRTCVLSKSWRHHWCTRPKVEICFNGKEDTFLSVVEETLGRYLDQNLSIHELRFRVLRDSNPAAEFLRKWIPKLRIFNIYLIAGGLHKFYIPSSVFEIEAESLQKLYLERCTLDQKGVLNAVLCKHLKTLHLVQVHVNVEDLKKMISTCPLLESVAIHSCSGFLGTIFSVDEKFHKIKHFEFSCHSFDFFYPYTNSKPIRTAIEFDVPSSAVIERISISRSPRNWFRNEYQITNLKSLSITSAKLSSELLDLFSCNMVSLKFLELIGCYGLPEFNLSLGSIKHFVFEHTAHSLQKKPINRPSIVFDIPSSALIIERIKISDCPAICFRNEYQTNLKSLSLTSVGISSELLDLFSWNMPILESLELVSCYGFQEFHLSSRSIKRFVFDHSLKTKTILRATIDAPNMLYFKYSTCYLPSLFSFTTTTESGHEWISDLTLDIYNSSFCFLELHRLLKELSGSQISLKLTNPNPPQRKRKRKITRDDEKAVGVDHLEVWLAGHSMTSRSAFVDELFGICHPRSLVGDKKTDGFLSKLFVKKRHYSWQQDLEDVSIETKDTPHRFRLKWREI